MKEANEEMISHHILYQPSTMERHTRSVTADPNSKHSMETHMSLLKSKRSIIKTESNCIDLFLIKKKSCFNPIKKLLSNLSLLLSAFLGKKFFRVAIVITNPAPMRMLAIVL